MAGSVGVFIYTPKQYRTFIESNAFEYIEKEYSLTYFLEIDVVASLVDDALPGNQVYGKCGSLLHRSGTFLATLKLWESRFSSPAHTFRAHASFGGKRLRQDSNSMILYNMEGWSEIKRFLVRSLGRKNVIKVFGEIRKFFLVQRFKRILTDDLISQLDVVFIPYSGLLTSEFDDLVTFFSYKSILTIGVQENWDNLSSKTFIVSVPDHFYLWGNQSKGHMKVIHRLDSTTPHIVGSPRFLPYFDQHLSPNSEFLDSLKGKKYVLFTGTGDGVDDCFILEATIRALATNKLQDSIKLVYRPHPFTRNPVDTQKIKSLVQEGVLLDNNEKRKSVFYHCSLIMNAELVINQFSTMLLEALSCNKKVLLPTFVGRAVNYDYSNAVNEWHHFVGLAAFPNVHLANDAEGYENSLLRAINAEVKESMGSADWMCAHVDSRVEFLLALKTIFK